MTVIKDIDSMFSVENYNKQVFDTFQNDLFGTADQVIKLMQDWTALKLINFNDLYFQDDYAIKNLSNLINYNKSTIKKTRAKISKKEKLKKSKNNYKKLDKQNE
jgi:predicted transcriptional regulator